MSISNESFIRARLAEASQKLELLRDTLRQKRHHLDGLKIMDRGMTAQAFAEDRPDSGRTARQHEIILAGRDMRLFADLVNDAERAFASLLAKTKPSANRKHKRLAGAADSRR